MKIVYKVEKDAVITMDKRMYKILQEANSTNEFSDYKSLQLAYRSLCIAKGIYFTLYSLSFIANGSTASEDINRIEDKINSLIEARKKYQRRNINNFNKTTNKKSH